MLSLDPRLLFFRGKEVLTVCTCVTYDCKYSVKHIGYFLPTMGGVYFEGAWVHCVRNKEYADSLHHEVNYSNFMVLLSEHPGFLRVLTHVQTVCTRLPFLLKRSLGSKLPNAEPELKCANY